MPKSTLRLDVRRKLNDGTYPVQIVVGHGTDLYLKTGIYATKNEWNTRTLQFTGRGSARVNAALTSMLSLVVNRIMELKESGLWLRLTRPQIKEMLRNLELERPLVGIPSLLEVFNVMGEGRSERSQRMIKSVALKVKAFGYDPHDLRFEQITRSWLEDFYASMTGLSVNTRAAYMKTVRRACNWALDYGYISGNPFRRFRIRTEETRMRDLPVETFRRIMSLELSGKPREYRDMFLLTFYLIGINTVDLASCTDKDIVNGRLQYRRHKTGKLYSIKIEPEAAEIIARYHGKGHLLECFDRAKNYKSMQGSINNVLQRLGEPMTRGRDAFRMRKPGTAQPIMPELSLYWARYSWATYAAELDVPTDTISEALGHSHGARVTSIYIRRNRAKVDAANRKVIDYVLGKIDAPPL